MATPPPALPMKITPLPRSSYPSPITYPPSAFTRQDETNDSEWYSQQRFVHHIDAKAITTLETYYSTIINPTHHVLDICSSWVSHLSASLKPQFMIGIGMNSLEPARNTHLTKYSVQDLNLNPTLEVEDESIDVVICNLSVDYLVQPIKIFEEMMRVLKVGGTAHMAFSNRYFPTKVIGAWMGMSDAEKRMWVGGYFWASGGWEGVEEVVLNEGHKFLGVGDEDPPFVVRGKKAVTHA
ncbi:hypothetical protein HYALB_00005452 [Hymenoscyphus albidus]|uniref:Methyltransferase type 11 domain-containing protein n=1 Tax=Hymenoscyphus albidus TaxID=595503 RepID=A0A9N9LHA5_9HELO|nr:hypothetical protein HYALB_00005452 [Hymenoscyphus albidus]